MSSDSSLPKIYKEERPWGSFTQFVKNQPVTVKTINVNPNEELSLQYHMHREEFWRVLKGNPLLTIGEKKIEAKPGDDFLIKKEELHRISSPNGEVEILEISFGEFDESDIVRVEDKYGRNK